MNLQEFATYVFAILAGMGGVVPVVNWLKNKLNATGFWALLLTVVSSVVFGILSLWQNGDLLPGSVSWSNFSELVLTVFFASQVYYRLIKGE